MLLHNMYKQNIKIYNFKKNLAYVCDIFFLIKSINKKRFKINSSKTSKIL